MLLVALVKGSDQFVCLRSKSSCLLLEGTANERDYELEQLVFLGLCNGAYQSLNTRLRYIIRGVVNGRVYVTFIFLFV